MSATASAVSLVRGDDPVLLSDAVHALVAELVGDTDASLAVEDLDGDEYEIAAVVDAAQTPPFLVERRVVVARGVGRFSADDVKPLVAYLADPLPTTALVLVGGGGTIPKPLVDAVKRAGTIVDAGAPTGRNRKGWFAEQVKAGPIRLDAAALRVLDEHLGDDVGRVSSLLGVLAAAYGEGATVGVEDVTPFLGEAGGAAPWDLTDAIDRGDVAGALEQLHRMTGAGGRHPLELLAVLHTHYRRMLRLDGSGATDEAAAASVLGMTGSTFPAKKALAQTRKLGSAGVSRAIMLLSQADLALKGEIDWPGDLVLEVLVARLARLGPRPASSRR